MERRVTRKDPLRLELVGQSGARYRYGETDFHREFYVGTPGNFVVLRARTDGTDVIYAGTHHDLFRLPEIILGRAFQDHQATHVMVRINLDANERSAEQQDIIAAYTPIMNRDPSNDIEPD
jgi:hypothetical protein